MAENALIRTVTEKRAEDACREVREHYPEAEVTFEVRDGRGVITACDGRFVVSKEFVETAESLSDPRCMREYAHVIQARSRLVVVVPRDRAARTRLRLLELNNWWLFYYQLHFYDENGAIRRMDRRTWRAMVGLPRDDLERPPEVA